METDKTNSEHGYKSNTVIDTKWILYSKDLTAEIPANHVLKRNSSVRDIIEDVLDQKTGVGNQEISCDVLLEQEFFTQLLRRLHTNWKPSTIKKCQLQYCSSSEKTINNTSTKFGNLSLSNCCVTKSMFGAETIYRVLGQAPVFSEAKLPSTDASSTHWAVSSNKHNFIEATRSPTCKTSFRDLENPISENNSQPMQMNKMSNKRKIECCSSPSSCMSNYKRLRKNEQQNDFLSDATSSNQDTKSVPPNLTMVEEKLLIQEIEYFIRDERNDLRETMKPTSVPHYHDEGSNSSIHVQQERLTTPHINKHHEAPVSLCRLLAFVSMSVRRLVPLDLFGSSSNRAHFLKVVRAVLTAGLLDEIYLQQLMVKFKITQCKWAHGLGSHFNKSFVVTKVLLWILQKIVLTIVEAFFYATETNKFNNMVVFYQKHTWCHLTDRALNDLVKTGSLKVVKKSGQENAIDAHSTNYDDKWNCCRLRFIPKAFGMRPIFPVKSPHANEYLLLTMRLLLKLIGQHYEEGSVSLGNRKSLTDVWENYNNKLRLNAGDLFIVKVDVTDAFGSVLHNVLLDLIDSFLERLPAIITFGVYAVHKKNGKLGRGRRYILLDDMGRPTEPIQNQNMTMSEVNVPIQVNTRIVAKTVRSYVQCQFVSAGCNREYKVVKGIAQGGTLSSVLCEVYYNAMFHFHWKTCVGHDDLLLHCVDDFLFVSPSKISAENFLTMSSKGVDRFNCFINPKKTLHNICKGDEPRAIRVPFCGITVCSLSRQLLVSAAHIISYPVRYTLKLNPDGQPGQFIAKRLSQITLARLPDSVIHPSYTTVAGLLANVFRVGLTSGARLEAMVEALLCPQNAGNERFLGSSVVAAGEQAWQHVAKLWGSKTAENSVTKDTVLLVYIEGVLSCLGLKRHVMLTGLMSSLRRLQRPMYERMSPKQRLLMPGMLAKMDHRHTTSRPGPICKVDKLRTN